MAICWCNWAHLISLHSLVDHFLLLPDVQCLVNYFKYFVHFFVASGREKDQSGPCYSILAGSVSLFPLF